MRFAPLVLALAGCAVPSSKSEVSDQALSICPASATVAGVDTSSWQGPIDWNAVKQSGRAFAIARVSDGLAWPDTRFAADWPAIEQAGLVRGAYQYFRASQDPIAQADYLVAQVGTLGASDLPAALDIETTDGQPASVVIARMQAWLARVAARTGKQPMIYTAAFMSSVIGDSFGGYPLWVANYDVSCPRLPSGWSGWRIWQSGDSGRVPGISGSVDVDVFDGTLEQLQAFAAGGGVAWSCAQSAWGNAQVWTCTSGHLYECQGGVPVERTCSLGCYARSPGEDDLCITSAPGWSCAQSSYAGRQYWTCNNGAIYRCDGGAPEMVACPSGCVSNALGANDACR